MMKRKLKIAMAIMMVIPATGLTGCSIANDPDMNSATVEEQQLGGQIERIKGNNVCSEWVDRETGVHYYYTYSGGLELRVNADGSPFCEKDGGGQ